MSVSLPVILCASALRQALDDSTISKDILVVDVSSRGQYMSERLPNAIHVDYAALNLGTPPATGLLPDPDSLMELAAMLGIAPNRPTPYIVAYDSEGGGKAARLAWTLDVLGFSHWSWLNGGLDAWEAEGGNIISGEAEGVQATTKATTDPAEWPIGAAARATRDDVLAAVDRGDVTFVDCRSEAEFRGLDVRAARGGHIPGAILSDWMDTFSPTDGTLLRPEAELADMFQQRGIESTQDIVVYCQTHHRSSLVYVVLKALGYKTLRGYDGSWSEWGNDPDTPIDSPAS